MYFCLPFFAGGFAAAVPAAGCVGVVGAGSWAGAERTAVKTTTATRKKATPRSLCNEPLLNSLDVGRQITRCRTRKGRVTPRRLPRPLLPYPWEGHHFRRPHPLRHLPLLHPDLRK